MTAEILVPIALATSGALVAIILAVQAYVVAYFRWRTHELEQRQVTTQEVTTHVLHMVEQQPTRADVQAAVALAAITPAPPAPPN